MEEVKIIYCYDDSKNAIHYSKTHKQGKYYCIDCGEELICKDGSIKVKHLAHKNTSRCRGTGETIFHKHWKENLFRAGMFIEVKGRPVEIYEVFNEVSLNQRYNKDWDIEIIVDVLLITEHGDVVVEINYSNPKDWLKLKPYYDQLDLLEVFEVGVGRYINEDLYWQTKDNILNVLLMKIEEKRKREEKLKKIEESKNAINQYKCYFNFKSKPLEIEKDKFFINTYIEMSYLEFQAVTLNFDLKELKMSKSQLINHFKVSRGIKYSYITVKGTAEKKSRNWTSLEVVKINKLNESVYNNDLYIKLCKIAGV